MVFKLHRRYTVCACLYSVLQMYGNERVNLLFLVYTVGLLKEFGFEIKR